MREEDEEFFEAFDDDPPMDEDTAKIVNNPNNFVNYRPRKKKHVVTPEEQAEADSHGAYLPNTWRHGAVVTDETDGIIRRVTYEDGFVRTRVAGIWC